MSDQLFNIIYVDLDNIYPNPYQARQKVDYAHVDNLAADIEKNGLNDIPMARDMGDGTYQLAFGHNRLAAFNKLAETYETFTRMPLLIQGMTDEEMLIKGWSENEHRKALNPVERATAMQRAIDEFGWTHDTVAEKFTVDRSTVTNLIRLLSLPGPLLDEISDGNVSQRQATALIPYFQLSPSEQEKLEADAEFSEFLNSAMVGQVNSDTIRDRVTAAIAEIHPAPPQLDFKSLDAILERKGKPASENKADESAKANTVTAEPQKVPYCEFLAWKVSQGVLNPQQAEAMNPFYEIAQEKVNNVLKLNGFVKFWEEALKGTYTSPAYIRSILGDYLHRAELVTPGDEKESQAWKQVDINGNEVDPEPVIVEEKPATVGAPAPATPVNQPALPTTAADAAAEHNKALYDELVRKGREISGQAARQNSANTPWADSFYSITLLFNPEDGDPNGRKMIITTRRGDGEPRVTDSRELAWNWNIPWQLKKLVDDLHPEDFEVEA